MTCKKSALIILEICCQHQYVSKSKPAHQISRYIEVCITYHVYYMLLFCCRYETNTYEPEGVVFPCSGNTTELMTSWRNQPSHQPKLNMLRVSYQTSNYCVYVCLMDKGTLKTHRMCRSYERHYHIHLCQHLV